MIVEHNPIIPHFDLDLELACFHVHAFSHNATSVLQPAASASLHN